MKKWNPEPGRISFNPRTPCGVRPSWAFFCCHCGMFQSTHSLRSATDHSEDSDAATNVSIHALLAECDPLRTAPFILRRCFNPRTPCGVRPINLLNQFPAAWFQSTHSLRSATSRTSQGILHQRVSIHALLAECDRLSRLVHHHYGCFNPRTPCGVRHLI